MGNIDGKHYAIVINSLLIKHGHIMNRSILTTMLTIGNGM